MMSWSASTDSPVFTRKLTIAASAMDSPNCGMMMGIWGMFNKVKGKRKKAKGKGRTVELYSTFYFFLFPFSLSVSLPQKISCGGGDAARGWAMGGPQVWMVRHGCIFGV